MALIIWSIISASLWANAAQALVVKRQASTPDSAIAEIDTAGIAAYASSVIAESNIKVYEAKPTQQVTDFNALGDSFTAGVGSNGKQDRDKTSGECRRYAKAYPYALEDDDTWNEINGNHKPLLHHGACTRAKMDDLIDKQLKPGEDNHNVHHRFFGKPQLAVLTIAGNDADFGQ